MRWKVLLVAAMLVTSGCITGDDESTDGEDEGQSLDVSTNSNGTAGNSSDNATYLKNSDYNQTHVHDYWPGISDEKVLMSQNVDTYLSFWLEPEDPDASVGATWFSLPNGSFVPVGTGNLTVEIDATGSLENGEISMGYNPANTARWTQMEAKGAQASWEIPVDPEQTDPPHAKSTDWEFRLEAEGNGAVLDGEVNVTILAHKTRDLDEWPEHPDFWDRGNRTQLHLANLNDTFDEQEAEVYIGPVRPEEKNLTLPEGTIVPPETEVLLLDFWYARSDAPKNAANADVELRVKHGSSSTWYSYAEHRIVQEKDGYKQYAIPVDGSSWDSPYVEESDWKFQVYAPFGANTQGTEARDVTVDLGFAEVGEGNVTLDATAFREPPEWLDQAMSENE